jgi:hypothetical protein
MLQASETPRERVRKVAVCKPFRYEPSRSKQLRSEQLPSEQLPSEQVETVGITATLMGYMMAVKHIILQLPLKIAQTLGRCLHWLFTTPR